MKLLLSFILVSFNTFGQGDFWIGEYDKNRDEYAYRDEKGQMRIPFGKYSICYTDTFRTCAIVVHPQLGFVGINREEEVLFQVYPFDNGPDEPSEGLFRIIKDSKIGFANNLGEIVIQPRFKAVQPFSESLAAYCEGCSTKRDDEHSYWTGGKWGFFDKKGMIVIKPRFDQVLKGFKNGKAKVVLDSKELWIDPKGSAL